MSSTQDRPPVAPEPRGDEAPKALEPVAPAAPVAPWFGGKRNLAKRIIERIEAVPHTCYAEPFVGMGGVFLRRAKRPRVEVVNDLNGEIANLFRVVREHPAELERQFRWVLPSREEYGRLLAVPPETLTDVQRAARLIFLQHHAYGGLLADSRPPSHMAVRPSVAAPRAGRIRRQIRVAHRRLQGVKIERLDWHEFIRRYDRDFTLFYIDPPYWGHEVDYGKGMFAREDFARMAELLRGLKGRFILSMNDRPEVRETFAGFRIEEVTIFYPTRNRSATRHTAELLISNG